MAFGVQPEGFVRKRQPDILAEIETAVIGTFGPGVIQTAQSPFGQINGLYSSLAAKLWEMYEDVYGSFDPDQAEGTRLDTIAKLRILSRSLMDDATLRQTITNAGRAQIDLQDIAAAVRSVASVEWAYVRVNESDCSFRDQAPRSVAAAAIGGVDSDVARALRVYTAPGVSTWGNTQVETAIDGLCRNVNIIRPVPVPIKLYVHVKPISMSRSCQPPTDTVLKLALIADLIGGTRLVNGEAPTIDHIRAALSSYPAVAVVDVVGAYSHVNDFSLFEIAEFTPENITVAYVGGTLV